MHEQQVADLVAHVDGFVAATSPKFSIEVEINASLLIHWLSFLKTYHLTGVADNLLSAVESAVRETAGCLSLGLARPALFSLRTEIDLMLAWLYFKDHPVEWEAVNITGDGYKMKKELLEYLGAHHSRFVARLSLLKEIARRKEAEPYRMLSAHIHGQSTAVLPVIIELKDLVRSSSICADCVILSFEVAEYINDILLAVFIGKWHALPKEVCSALEERFVSAEQRGTFFEGV